MNNEDMQSRDVARLLDQTAVRAFKMEVNEIIPAFDEAEAACLTLVSSKESEAEVKRQVAGWKLRLLCDRDVPFELVEILHNRVIELGYTNPEIEGSTEIYFAKYCVRQNQTDVGRRILHQLCSKLDVALKVDDQEVYRHFKEVSQELLSNLEQKPGSESN